MGKLILICGTNGSGKSAFAEKLAAETGGELFYIATMLSKTPDNAARIKKHICQREALNVTTVELTYRVGDAPVPDGAVILLEDVSNLMANCLFDRRENASHVLSDIFALLERCGTLIAVTISGLGRDAYTGETAVYIDALNDLNRALFNRADTAIEMINRMPCIQKGELKRVL